MKKQSIITLILAVFISSFAQAKVVYVNKNATGATHNGSSWATAFTTVQSGVNASVSGDEVWVAKSAPAAEAYVENVTMKENVALYGGFVGTETERSQRNWTANVTVIESPSGGSSVVKASVSAVILDGFTISNGASGVLVTGSATVTNCTISRNYNAGVSVASEGAVTVKKCFVSGNGGYGIYVDPGTATVYNSTISNNVRHGIWIRSGTATVKDNIISDNLWHGFSVSSGTAIVMNCAIGGNRSSGVHADSGIATVTNCTVNSNSEDGIFVSASGTAIVTNCTISGNTYGTDVYDGTATISNSIVTFNGTGIRRTSTGYSLTLSYNDVYGNTTANYSNITDPTGTNGNISVDPLLSNPYRDIHIQPGSPCRDAGNDALVQPGWTDIDGQPRIQGAHVDIGSDESDGTTWTVPVATRFVKPTGDDGNDGLSWATAKKTITSALTVSQGLDEIWVSAGTYTENVSIPLGVTLYGGFVGTETERNRRNWATNVTTIASPSTSSDVVTVNSPGVTLDGFTIQNGDDGVYVYGTTTVSNCVVSGNSSYGVYVNYGTATVSNCVVSGNSSNGVYVSYGTATVSNCTISGNSGSGVYMGSSGTTVTNSIVAFNGTGIRRYSTGYSLTLSYNDVYGNTTANYSNITDPTGTNGNISVDPLLSNPYRDIHIQPGSPCRDAGNDALVQPGWTDIDGQPRIQGAHVDIGSDESDGTTWTVPVATRFVKPTGDDGNDGLSWATAKKTITSALTVSQGLDEIWVSAGTYTENVSIPLGVTLYGGFVGTETERNQRNWATNVTTIASPSTSSDVVTSNFHGAILDGFSIRDGDDGVYVYGTTTVSNCVVSGNSSYGVYVSDGTATVSNCTITENSLYGVYVGSGGTATVANCTVSENALYGIRVFSGGMAKVANCTISGNSIGVYVYNGGAATVTNCTIEMNSDDGVRVYLGGATVTLTNCKISGNRNGVFVHDTGAATVANCTISGNDSYGAYVNSGGSKLSNCLVTLNDKGVYSGHSPTLSHNDVYGNTTANYTNIADPTGRNGNISADPLFVDRAAGNFHLLPGSPCIDAGDDSVVTAGQTDLDGQPRIQGAHVDMGSYETSGVSGYRWWDAARALSIAGGAIQATAADIAFLNKDSSDGVITIRDAARIARKAAGLDANP